MNKEDTVLINKHPLLEYENKKVALSGAQTAVDKAKLSPDFTIGYSNQSIIGFQARDGVTQQYYGATDRFNTAMVTVGIPLFNKATKAKIRAGKVNQEVAMLEVNATKQFLVSRLNELYNDLKKQKAGIDYYEKTGLQQAALIMKNSSMANKQGQISYLEWTMLMNNAVNIELSYLQSVQYYNNAVIEINYLTGN